MGGFVPSYADVFIGAPLFMDRGSDGKLQEVGQVCVSLQRPSGGFQTTRLHGFEVFARFGSAIAPLGDLDQDGFNGEAEARGGGSGSGPVGDGLHPREQPPSRGGCEWPRRTPSVNREGVPFP